MINVFSFGVSSKTTREYGKGLDYRKSVVFILLILVVLKVDEHVRITGCGYAVNTSIG